jgi:hypothetical protein
MLIDCDGCVVRGAACGDCVVSVLLGAPPGGVEIDESERRALTVLADAGMVPRLRLITEGDGGGSAPAGRGRQVSQAHSSPPTSPGAEPLPGTGDPAVPPPRPRPPASRRPRHVA